MKTVSKLIYAIFLGLFILCYQSVNAGATPRIAIEVIHNGNDAVGDRLTYQIKENIRSSKEFRIAVQNEPRLVLSLSTMELQGLVPGHGIFSVYSVAWYLVAKDGSKFFVWHIVGCCGSNRIKDQAETLVADTDRLLSALH